jgi:chromosome segregation ATPase
LFALRAQVDLDEVKLDLAEVNTELRALKLQLQTNGHLSSISDRLSELEKQKTTLLARRERLEIKAAGKPSPPPARTTAWEMRLC